MRFISCSLVVVAALAACTISDTIAEGEFEGEGEGEAGEGEGEGEGEVVGRAFDCDGDSLIVADVGCSADADCGLVNVNTDCCGSPRQSGINADDAARFAAAYASCTAGQPVCDCIGGPTSADDGTVDRGDDVVGVACVEGACTSSFGGGDREFDCAAGGSIVVDAACAVDEDCGVVVVALDCCGSQAATGVAAVAQRGVSFTAQQCAAALDDCDCRAEPTVADDGSAAPDVTAPANVACLDGLCRTTFGP